MSDTIAAFFEAWGETDADARVAVLRPCISDIFCYVDPRTPDPITDVDGFVGLGAPE